MARAPGPRPRRRAPFGKDVVLAYLQSNPDADRRQVARDLRLKAADRRLLKAIFAELAPARAAPPPVPPDQAPAAPEAASDILAARVLGFDDETAEPILAPAEWLRAGRPPRIRLRRLDAAALAPGSRALVRIDRRDGGEWRGRLLRAADDLPERVVGVVRASPQGQIVEPADRRLRQEFLLVPGAGPPPRAGDLVVARPLPARRFERPRAALLEHLGDSSSPRAASAIALALHDIPVEFPAAALAEARRCPPAAHDATRADLRAVRLVTIDGADARDFDDAVHAEPDLETEGWRITVAIADVAWHVRPGSALDQAAARRGNSVYFPDRVVPMLPERLSNDLCSLRPHEDRPVLAAELRIDPGGTLRAHRFLRATMRSAARLTYDQVQAWRDGNAAALPSDLHMPARHLFAAYAALATARARRGTLDLDLPERAVTLGPDGRIAAIAPRARHDAHRLIEEMMILANVAAAESLERQRRPCLYRIHERPSDERLDALAESLAALGYRLARGQGVRPGLLRDVLTWAAGKPCQDMVSDLVLRSQALAIYSPENPGHFGLALPRYAHFTSPIRRYADLVVHRALIEAHGLGEGGARPAPAELAATGEEVSRAERRAQAAERAALERHVAQFLAAQVGASFAARVSGLHRAGIFVTLTETGAEGLVPMSSLPGRWRLHPAGHALEGPGGRIALADKVTVRLVEAAGISGALRFDLDLARADGGPRARARPGPGGRRAANRRPA